MRFNLLQKSYKDQRLKLLSVIYISGIVIAFCISISGMPNFFFLRTWFPYLHNYLWLFSVSHMAILVVLGYTYFAPISTIAGSKIQTAGYIHTLIGITAALLSLNPQSFTLSAFLSPWMVFRW